MAFQKRDLLFVSLIVVVLGIFIAISGEEKTTRVPYDDLHKKFYPIIKEDGKKAGEKFCGECHNPDGVPFAADHPPKFRCLFCHKLEEGK
ncbi:MAG: cytochrome c [Desulfuromonas sp.]|nr:MAG: cytochrome c [Desulfuromonas sp.]